MVIQRAIRKRIPGLIGIGGVSGSGKTMSALLLAAGMIGEGKRVGFIDTEMGRGSMYADDALVTAALPDGYDILELTDPFTPEAYDSAVDQFEKTKEHDVVIIDSMTHEWEGFGGCVDIAENNRLGRDANWALAKVRHKRMMNKMLARPFHIIFCLRAREKSDQVMVDGKKKYIDRGIQPIQEKNFKFEMLISMMMDEKTKMPVANHDFEKKPEPLKHLFTGERFITPEDGRMLKTWIDGGNAFDEELAILERDCRDAAHGGTSALVEYWNKLSAHQKAKVNGYKDECKEIAAEVDRQMNQSTGDEDPIPSMPDEPLIDNNAGI